MKHGEGGGPRALRAFGKACRVNERIDCKTLMVYSSETWTRETRQLESANKL